MKKVYNEYSLIPHKVGNKWIVEKRHFHRDSKTIWDTVEAIFDSYEDADKYCEQRTLNYTYYGRIYVGEQTVLI